MNLFLYELHVNSDSVSDIFLSKSNYDHKGIDRFLNYLIKHIYNIILRNYNFVVEELKKEQ